MAEAERVGDAPPAQPVDGNPTDAFAERTSPPMGVKTPEERKALLTQQLAREIAGGGRVDSQSDYLAVMVYGKRVNHILHFIIGVFTLGLWWLVWIALAIFGGERRKMFTVDEYGIVTVRDA